MVTFVVGRLTNIYACYCEQQQQQQQQHYEYELTMTVKRPEIKYHLFEVQSLIFIIRLLGLMKYI